MMICERVLLPSILLAKPARRKPATAAERSRIPLNNRPQKKRPKANPLRYNQGLPRGELAEWLKAAVC